MNNFDIDSKGIDEMMKWLRKPTLYGMVIFDILVILLVIHWSYGYIWYSGFILLFIFVNKCYNNPLETPTIVKQYFGMS
jgi:hypothetical protein